MALRRYLTLFPARAAIAVLLAALMALSANLFSREFDQYMRGILSDSDGFEHWTNPDHEDVFSANAQIDLLSGCVFALESWKTAFQAKDAVLNVAKKCADEADNILAMNPQLSEAHYLKAYHAYLIGDEDAVRASLGGAQSTAPTDQWLAVRRVNLSQKLWPGEPLVGDYDLQSDLGLLIASNHGLDTATRLYIRYPSLRELIVLSTEELEDQDRLRFLNRLKSAVARM